MVLFAILGDIDVASALLESCSSVCWFRVGGTRPKETEREEEEREKRERQRKTKSEKTNDVTIA